MLLGEDLKNGRSDLTMRHIFDNRDYLLFGYGRTALEFGYEYLGLTGTDEILYPEYICDVAVLPAKKTGINIKYYAVKDNLEPDFESASKLITDKTRAFLAVNYFGFPQPFGRIREFCKQHGLYYIEDNAHSFLSRHEGKYLGTFGDISILSFRKIFPLVNGAALLINNRMHKERFTSVRHRMDSLEEEKGITGRMKHSLQRLCRNNDIDFTRIRKRSLHIPEPGSTEEEDLPYRIDRSTLPLLSKCDFADEAGRRRSRYHNILSTVNSDLTPVFGSLPENIVPMGCPFYTNDRNKWLKVFRDRRIRAYPWPTLPGWIAQNKKSALLRWEKIIVFTV